MTGTPFRGDDTPDALRDHVVRPVVFMNCGGPMRWRTKSGDEDGLWDQEDVLLAAAQLAESASD